MTDVLVIDVVATVGHLVMAVVPSFVDALAALIVAGFGQPATLLVDGLAVTVHSLTPAGRAIAPLLPLAVVSLAFWAGWRRWRS